MTYNELLQEVIDFKEYGQCLDKEHYKVYKNYLKKRLLKEYTIKNLKDFIKDIFENTEINISKVTIGKHFFDLPTATL